MTIEQRAGKIAENVIQFMRNLNWKPTLFSNDEIPERAEMLAVNSILQELKAQPPVPKSVQDLAEEIDSLYYRDQLKIVAGSDPRLIPSGTTKETAQLITSFLDSRIEGAECKWTENEDGYWETSCDNAFEITNEEPPIKNGFKFCCYCGGRLTQDRFDDSGKQSFGITKE